VDETKQALADTRLPPGRLEQARRVGLRIAVGADCDSDGVVEVVQAVGQVRRELEDQLRGRLGVRLRSMAAVVLDSEEAGQVGQLVGLG